MSDSQSQARALAQLASRCAAIDDSISTLCKVAEDAPLTIRIEVNNLQEVMDLLRFKIREATLARVIRASHERDQGTLI